MFKEEGNKIESHLDILKPRVIGGGLKSERIGSKTAPIETNFVNNTLILRSSMRKTITICILALITITFTIIL